jgi:hypothetical protein
MCSNDFNPLAEKKQIFDIECDTKMSGSDVFDA